jgi:hypothetical protein
VPPEPVTCAWADKRRSDRQRSATTIHSLRGFDVETEVEFTLAAAIRCAAASAVQLDIVMR